MGSSISDNGWRLDEVVSVSERFGRINAVSESFIRPLNTSHGRRGEAIAGLLGWGGTSNRWVVRRRGSLGSTGWEPPRGCEQGSVCDRRV